MPKKYEPADAETMRTIRHVAENHHARLLNNGVKIGAVMVWPPVDSNGQYRGHAITRHGHRCLARIKKRRDDEVTTNPNHVTIFIDALGWEESNPDRQRAIIDNALEHVVLNRVSEEHGPILSLQPDEIAFTGFYSVIARNGAAAVEYQSVRDMVFTQDSDGNLLFDFAKDIGEEFAPEFPNVVGGVKADAEDDEDDDEQDDRSARSSKPTMRIAKTA